MELNVLFFKIKSQLGMVSWGLQKDLLKLKNPDLIFCLVLKEMFFHGEQK